MLRNRRSNIFRRWVIVTVFIYMLMVFLTPVSIVSAQVDNGGSSGMKKTTRSYVPLDKNMHLVIDNGDKNLVITDYLSSTRKIVNEGGGNDFDVQYYPYGETEEEVDTNALPTERLFTSHRKMNDISVYHVGARFYSPTMGLFVQPDNASGFNNKYSYGLNNPTLYNDPDGNIVFIAAIAIIGVAAFLMTTPIKDSPSYPNPEFDENAARWAETGGPEFSMNMLRMNPVVGIPAAATELATGKDIIGGNELTARAQILNAAELAGMGASKANHMIGAYNKGINRARVSRYQYGADLLNARTVDEAEAVIKTAVPDITFGIDRAHIGGAVYKPSTKEILYGDRRLRILEATKHEGVHALQFKNNLMGVSKGRYSAEWTFASYARKRMLGPTLNPRVNYYRMKYNADELRGVGVMRFASEQFKAIVRPYNLDLEMMAYASTGGTGYLQQLGGAMMSTGRSGSRLRNAGLAVGVSGYATDYSSFYARSTRTIDEQRAY